MPLATFDDVSYKRAVLSQDETNNRLELLGENASEEMPSCGGLSSSRSLPGSMAQDIRRLIRNAGDQRNRLPDWGGRAVRHSLCRKLLAVGRGSRGGRRPE